MYPSPAINYRPLVAVTEAMGPHEDRVEVLSIYGPVIATWLVLAVVLLAAHRLVRRHVTRRLTFQADGGLFALPERREWLLLGGLFLVALWLRAGAILVEPLEIQEVSELYPIFEADVGLPDGRGWLAWLWLLLVGNEMEPHQFAFPVLLYPFRDMVGDVRSLRYVPALCGALLAPMGYVLALATRLSRAEAAAGAVLIAIAPFHVFFSRTLVPYTLVNLAFVAVGICLTAYLASDSSPRPAVRRWFCAAVFASLATHFVAVTYLAVLLGGGLLAARKHENRWLLLQDTLLAGVCFLPFAGRALVYAMQPNAIGPHALLMETGMFVDRPFWPELVSYMRYAVASVGGLIQADPPAILRTLLAAVTGFLLLAGAVTALRRGREASLAIALPGLLFLVLLACLLPIAVYQKQQGIYFPPRRLVLLYPWAAMLVALGAVALGRRLDSRVRNGLAALAVCALSVVALRTHYVATFPDAQELGRAIRSELRPDDGILIGPATWMRWIVFAGLLDPADPRWIERLDTADFFGLDYEPEPVPRDRPAEAVFLNMTETFTFAATHLQRERLQRVWLVHLWQHTAGWPEIVEDHDHQARLQRLLEEHFDAERVIERRGATATLYVRRSRPQPPADGYRVDLAADAHPFLSLTWPAPGIAISAEHPRHLLVGGRLDVPLPGPGRWTIDLETRYEGAVNRNAADFLSGLATGGYERSTVELSEAWKTLTFRVEVAPQALRPTYVIEFRGDRAERPMSGDSWEHAYEVLVDYVRQVPLQVRSLEVRRDRARDIEDPAPLPGALAPARS